MLVSRKFISLKIPGTQQLSQRHSTYMSMHQTAPSEAEAAEDTSGLRRGSPAPAAAAMGPPPDGGPPGRPALEVTVESFDDGQPQPRCVVYMDLTREECSRLFPSGRAHSQPFRFAGQGFFLTACCGMDLHRSSDHCFGLFLAMQKESAGSSAAAGVVTTVVDYDFAARTTTSSSGEFVSRYSGCYSFAGGKAVGYRNLFGTPWPAFMADDSEFFVDGVLHLRAELCVKQP